MDDFMGPFIFGAFIGLIFGGVAGTKVGIKHMKLQAVSAGVAEFVLDPKTGDSEWRWKQ